MASDLEMSLIVSVKNTQTTGVKKNNSFLTFIVRWANFEK